MEAIYTWDQVLILCLFYSCNSSPWRIWFVNASKWNALTEAKKRTPQMPDVLVFALTQSLKLIPINTVAVSLENTLPLSSLALPPSLSSIPPSFLIFFRLNKQGTTLSHTEAVPRSCMYRNTHSPSSTEAWPLVTASPASQKRLLMSQNLNQSPRSGDKVVSLIFHACS